MHSTTTIPMLCREVLCRPIVYQANSEKRGRQGRPRTKYLSPPPHPLLQYYLLEKIRNGVQPIDTIVTLYSDRTHSTLEADSAFSGLASEGCAVRRTFFFLLARSAVHFGASHARWAAQEEGKSSSQFPCVFKSVEWILYAEKAESRRERATLIHVDLHVDYMYM